MDFADLWHRLSLTALILYWALISAIAQTRSNCNAGKTSDLTPEQFVSTYSHHRLSSDFILSLYRNLSKGVPLNQATGRPETWRTVKAADTIRTFPAIAAYQMNQQLVYKFNMSQVDRNERLRTVELRLRLPPAWKSRQELHALAVASHTNALIHASSIPTVTTRFAADEVTIMDITTAVRDWFDIARSAKLHEDLTLDLVFNVVRKRKVPRRKMLRMLHRRDSFKNAFDAILVAYTKASEFFLPTDTELSFEKNVTQEHDEGSRAIFEASATESILLEDGESLAVSLSPVRLERSVVFKNIPLGEVCHRRDLEIDFLAIGWGKWVVYPTKFNAYQCGGTCGGFANSRNNPTNHAIVQSLMRLDNASKIIPMSCCTPTKLSPLNILYLEKGEVVIKHHQEMIVDECGCL